MGVELRSGKKIIMNKSEVTRLVNELLMPLTERVETQNKLMIEQDRELRLVNELLVPLQERVQTQNKLVIEQVREIDSLNEKMVKMDERIFETEHQIRYMQNMQNLMHRKIEAQNQYSRRNSLRVKGIPLSQMESPASLLKRIQGECRKLKLGLQDLEFERAHRIGKQYILNGRWHQAVLVKMISWGARNTIFEARGKSQYKWSADLTNERSSLLTFARNEAEEMNPIDFVFVDRNCQLMVKTTSGKFFSFSSKIEFMTLVSWVEAHDDVEERYDNKYEEYLESVSVDGADDEIDIDVLSHNSVPTVNGNSNEGVKVNTPTPSVDEGTSNIQDPNEVSK